MGLLMDPSVPFPQPRHWVIGDIHGCHSCMVALLDVLPKKDHLIFCGDVINGGPQIEACMTLAWDLMRCGQATWLRGNHEQRLIEALALELLVSPVRQAERPGGVPPRAPPLDGPRREGAAYVRDALLHDVSCRPRRTAQAAASSPSVRSSPSPSSDRLRR